MRAFVMNRYGKREKLHLGEVEPAVKENDILVEIHSAGVNLLDSKMRDGEFKLLLPYKPPFILGHDVAGVIRSVGSRVNRFQSG